MSTRETPMTRRFWKQCGGCLIEEHTVVPGSRGRGSRRRFVDGLILPGRPQGLVTDPRTVPPSEFRGANVAVVQTKDSRLGTYLMGQAVFSGKLVEQWLEPRSVRSVAVCSADDSELHPLLDRFGVEVVVLGGLIVRREGKAPRP